MLMVPLKEAAACVMALTGPPGTSRYGRTRWECTRVQRSSSGMICFARHALDTLTRQERTKKEETTQVDLYGRSIAGAVHGRPKVR